MSNEELNKIWDLIEGGFIESALKEMKLLCPNERRVSQQISLFNRSKTEYQNQTIDSTEHGKSISKITLALFDIINDLRKKVKNSTNTENIEMSNRSPSSLSTGMKSHPNVFTNEDTLYDSLLNHYNHLADFIMESPNWQWGKPAHERRATTLLSALSDVILEAKSMGKNYPENWAWLLHHVDICQPNIDNARILLRQLTLKKMDTQTELNIHLTDLRKNIDPLITQIAKKLHLPSSLGADPIDQ